MIQTGWRERMSQLGAGGSSSTSRSTSSGRPPASSMAASAPIELPTITAGRSVRASMNSARNPAWAWIEEERPARGERPKPGRSGAITLP